MPLLDERAATRRLLDRLGFGPRPAELDQLAAGGFTAAVQTVLGATPDPVTMPDLGPDPGRPGKQASPAERKQAQQALRQQELKAGLWWLDRMVTVKAALPERLTWFWHGHFATGEQKVRGPRLMLRQNQQQRQLGAGSFTALAKSMVTDPALLLWLDGQDNRSGSPNENLAREFMELFALGIGHYTENDVREAARALTGWTVDRAAVKANLVAKRHDGGAKTVLGTTGPLDANSLVDVLLGRADSPRFIASRLWFRLVSSDPVPADALNRLVAGYGPGRDVTGLLRALVAEPAFRDPGTALVKQPVEWAVGLMRALDVVPSKLPSTQLLAELRGMGQVPFEPPSVGGWPAGQSWLTTSADLARLHLAQLITQHADLAHVANAEDARRLLGVDAWSQRTSAALSKLKGAALVAVAACAPEYVVST
ncbi:DUF1800 domain-containing protein [Kutzneria viridogrisea]|uniref:DUF1800 domain-containing protein n=2 Tax=Kutzneria TaxID=43356 RepID=W5W3H9_9PSEU|nr:DUF1800 domain-containing protein [Kutzneria albida]AHH95335.1 hypothetical protein KALB_1965 [Kutzneria albida DSM 43870]MBA8927308.1 uncharacterized protein (DUF1800 family) [Kutzneria viridogrisea]